MPIPFEPSQFKGLLIHSAGEISAILSLTQHVNCLYLRLQAPCAGTLWRGKEGPGILQWPLFMRGSYRRISPPARRVLPGILSSLCPPWCSGVGAVVPVERQDYRLLGDSRWWISNSTVAPLNWRPTGSTGVKMAALLHPGNPRSSLHLRLHPHAKSRNKPLSQITPTSSVQTTTNPVCRVNLTIQWFNSFC